MEKGKTIIPSIIITKVSNGFIVDANYSRFVGDPKHQKVFKSNDELKKYIDKIWAS